MQEELTKKYEQRDSLNGKIKNLMGEVDQMENAREYLEESLADLKKVTEDLQLEQKRIV